MPSSRTRSLPPQDYPTGVFNIPESNLPNWATSIQFELARYTPDTPQFWPDQNTTVTISLEVRVDGEWRSWGSWQSVGGLYLDEFGVPVAYSSGRFGLPAGTNRRVRGQVVIEAGPLFTEGYLALEG